MITKFSLSDVFERFSQPQMKTMRYMSIVTADKNIQKQLDISQDKPIMANYTYILDENNVVLYCIEFFTTHEIFFAFEPVAYPHK